MMETRMPILCNLTCGLLLAVALIVPQYAGAASVPPLRVAAQQQMPGNPGLPR
jgi:hypothetical protein